MGGGGWDCCSFYIPRRPYLRKPWRMVEPPSILKHCIFPELDDVGRQCGVKGSLTISEGRGGATAVGRPWVGHGWAAHAGTCPATPATLSARLCVHERSASRESQVWKGRAQSSPRVTEMEQVQR